MSTEKNYAQSTSVNRNVQASEGQNEIEKPNQKTGSETAYENGRANEDENNRVNREEAKSKTNNGQNIRKNDLNQQENMNRKAENDHECSDKSVSADQNDHDIQDYEMAQKLGNRNLFLYYNAEGRPRFGRHEPNADNSERANPLTIPAANSSPPKQIEVHCTNRNTKRNKPRYSRNIEQKQNLHHIKTRLSSSRAKRVGASIKIDSTPQVMIPRDKHQISVLLSRNMMSPSLKVSYVGRQFATTLGISVLNQTEQVWYNSCKTMVLNL